MKKIALIIPNLGPGGAERALSRLSKVLDVNDNDINVIIFEDVEKSYEVSGKIINLMIPAHNNKFMKIVNVLKRTYKLKKIKKAYKFDIAISFLEGANFVNIFSKTKEKSVISIRNYKSLEINSLSEKVQNFFIKYLYKKADEIVAVSKLIKEDLITNYKIKDHKIKVIYNSYDINEIKSQSIEQVPIEYENLFENHKVISTVGRLTFQKGHWNLIKAFSIFLKKNNGYKLLIVGEGELENDLKQLALDLNLQDDVIFGGYLSNPFPVIKKSEIYILSSLFEGFPNALIEAMCCSKPVISTDCKSGPQEILMEKYNSNYEVNKIENSDYGILVPSFDAKLDFNLMMGKTHYMLSDAIEQLISDPQKINHYETKSLDRAKQYSNQISFEKWMEIIKD